jgi:hypothetical protein
MKKTNFKTTDFSVKETLTMVAQQTVKGGRSTVIIEEDVMVRGVNSIQKNSLVIEEDVMM